MPEKGEPSGLAPPVEQNPDGSMVIEPSTTVFSLPPSDFLAARPHIHNLIAGAMIFRPTGATTTTTTLTPAADDGSSSTAAAAANPYQTLLLRRAATDSYPLKWEVPAGKADPEADSSIIDTAVRELREETGLRASFIVCPVSMGIPTNASVWIEDEGGDAKMDNDLTICLLPSAGRTWAVVTFMVLVEPGQEWGKIELTPEEHTEYAWVTEEEVKTCKMKDKGGAEFEFVSEAMRLTILEGFRVRTMMQDMIKAANSAVLKILEDTQE